MGRRQSPYKCSFLNTMEILSHTDRLRLISYVSDRNALEGQIDAKPGTMNWCYHRPPRQISWPEDKEDAPGGDINTARSARFWGNSLWISSQCHSVRQAQLLLPLVVWIVSVIPDDDILWSNIWANKYTYYDTNQEIWNGAQSAQRNEKLWINFAKFPTRSSSSSVSVHSSWNLQYYASTFANCTVTL